MKKGFLVSLVGALAPTTILTTMTIMQLGNTKLGGILILYQAGYVLLLLVASILLFVLRKKDVAGGLLAGFAVGLFVLVVRVGIGI